MKKKSESRRNFLLKGISNRKQLITDIASLIYDEDQEVEKIKMLTPDGKLVEVDRRVVESAKAKSKASNSDILNWLKGGDKTEG